MKQVKAIAKNVRGSARKARIPADAVRGMNALLAIDHLKYTPKKAALDVMKVVKSAVANAVENESMKAEDLTISKIYVGEAFTMKRFRPESKGRARRIMKRNCHITVFVTDGSEVVAKSAPKTEEAKVKETTKPIKATKTTKPTKPTTKSTKK